MLNSKKNPSFPYLAVSLLHLEQIPIPVHNYRQSRHTAVHCWGQIRLATLSEMSTSVNLLTNIMSATLLVPWQYMHAGSQWSHAMSADPTLGANVSVTVTMSAGAQTMSSVPKQCTSEIVGWPKQWDASSTEGTGSAHTRDNVLIVLIWSFFQAFIDQEHTHTSQNCRIHSQIFITFVSKLYHVNCSEHGIGLEVFVFNRRNPILTNVSHAKWSIYQLSTKICSERVICNQGKPKLIHISKIAHHDQN